MAVLKAYTRVTDGLYPSSFTPRGCDRELVARVQQHAADHRALTDHQLAEKAAAIRSAMRSSRPAAAERRPVVDVFALATEAMRRTTGMSYFDVQLLAGLALSTGAVAEVETGEGKTITAAIPAIWHALAGKAVHIATVNAYLAERDHDLVAPCLRLLGITVGLLREKCSPSEKYRTYQQEVVYGTGYEFGFDYLRDQSAARSRHVSFLGERFRQQLRGISASQSRMMQRAHHVAIIDEIDSVLIDEANTPLVLSGGAPASSLSAAVFAAAQRAAASLQEKTHYVVDWRARHVQLTELGRTAIFDRFDTLPHDGLVRPWASYVEQALRAELLLKRDVDYVVQDGQLKLVDQYTGRIFSDRAWKDGLHQAAEHKEGIEITDERAAIARVSRQRYFGLYQMLCGMTGTASGHEHEFRGFYGLPVVVIPRRLPNQRTSCPTWYFATREEKFHAIAQDVQSRVATGQPILIGTKTIDESELLSQRLGQLQLPHELLNGKQTREEAEIVAQAGRGASVTIATNMAGRGTDIQLDESAHRAGGLHVIQTQRQDSARVDRQLIGRCARQGQPGSHQCFVSAEDDLVVAHGGDLPRRMASRCRDHGPVASLFDREMDQIQRLAERQRYQQRAELFRQDQWLDEVLAKVAAKDQHTASLNL